MATSKNAVETLLTDGLSDSARRAIDTVRGAGGQVSEFAVELLAKIERGEISHEQAVAELDKRYRAS